MSFSSGRVPPELTDGGEVFYRYARIFRSAMNWHFAVRSDVWEVRAEASWCRARPRREVRCRPVLSVFSPLSILTCASFLRWLNAMI